VIVAATSEFTAEERNLLVRLPRWIVGAAIASGGPKSHHESDNGFLSVANGRRLGNPLVAELADATLRVFDQDPKRSGVDPSTQEGIDLVVGYAQTAMAILRSKADEADAAIYRRWLLQITDDVITTVRTIGGVQTTPAQRSFRERLADVTRATPPTT
jgi:hypothetical protein